MPKSDFEIFIFTKSNFLFTRKKIHVTISMCKKVEFQLKNFLSFSIESFLLYSYNKTIVKKSD